MENTEHNYARGVNQQADSHAEHSRTTVEPEFPHKTHDLSVLSQHYLDVTAFTPNVSMGTATRLHPSRTNITETFDSIPAKLLCSKDLLQPAFNYLDHHIPDFDRVGIICECKDKYLIIVEVTRDEKDKDEDTIRHGWLEKRHVGMYFISEWESLSTQRIGEHCIVATGSTDGWWHSHSKILMDIRSAVVRRLTSRAKLTEKLIMAYLNGPVGGDIKAVYRAARIREEEVARKAESAMNEFTVGEEEQE
jgi:hypothetical protein